MISPAEIFQNYLMSNTDLLALAGGQVVTGGATRDEINAGVVIVSEAGSWRVAKYAPIIYPRIQIRCAAPELSKADAMGYQVRALTHQVENIIVRQTSDEMFLIHSMEVNGGPTHMKGEDDVTWESVLFVNPVIGTDPLV